MFAEDLRGMIERNDMVILAGDTGAGKTTLFNDVVRQLGELVRVVRVRSLDKERLKISAIVNSLIYDLSQENPRRDFEARSRQLQRIIGEVTVMNRQKVVLVIENAHRLHGNTILALKELREMDFAGQTHLFGIVLIGQSGLLEKVRRLKEIALRAETVEMTAENGWMTFAERKRFLKHLYGDLLSEEVRAQAALAAATPLELRVLIERKLESAYYAGKSQLYVSDFDIPLDKMKDVVGISLKELSETTGLDRSTVSRVINAKYDNPKLKQIIREALERKASEMQREAI